MKAIINLRTLPVLILLIAAIHANGQGIEPAILNAAGGQKVIAGNTYEWSVGEMALVHTATGTDLIITQGILQPAAAVNSVSEVPFLSDKISVYPNPTQGRITIAPNLRGAAALQIKLVDLLGRTMIHQTPYLMTGQEAQQLNIESYASGIYLLTIRAQQNTQVFSSTYKIQKK